MRLLVIVTAAFVTRRGSATCCATENKCCGHTYQAAMNTSCDSSICCDSQCQGEALLSDIISPPNIPLYVRNKHDRVLSAGCCDFFFPGDGTLCRSDFGDDCTHAKRCRLFAADCLTCESFCAVFQGDHAVKKHHTVRS